MMQTKNLQGAGWLVNPKDVAALAQGVAQPLDFVACQAQQWLGLGGAAQAQLGALAQRYRLACHSRSLSIGGPAALDQTVLHDLRQWMAQADCRHLTEQLAWSSDDAPLYSALPISSTAEAARWTAQRIVQVQEALGFAIGVSNVVHFMAPAHVEMDEPSFITQVVQASGCQLHLDVSALWVNSQNFGFNAQAYLQALPLAALNYAVISGVRQCDNGLWVQDPQQAVSAGVWQLLSHVFQTVERPVPTCLMREVQSDEADHQLEDVAQIARLQFRVPTHS